MKPLNYGDPDGFGRYGILERTETTVQCHECGKSFRTLAQHLHHRHEMSTDEYKQAHGLPATLPLTCLQTSQNLSEKSKERIGTPGWKRFKKRNQEILPLAQSLAAKKAVESRKNRAAVTEAARKHGQDLGQQYRLERAHESWMTHFQATKTFIAIHGRWPNHSAGKNKEERLLGRWVNHQRQMARKNSISAERLQLLTTIGFDAREDYLWWLKLEKTTAWAGANGGKRPSASSSSPAEERSLGRWIKIQQRALETGDLAPEQVKSFGQLMELIKG